MRVRPPKLPENITGNVFRPVGNAPMHPKIPKYRCYKPKNLGLVDIDGKQHYLGRYGSPESVAAYNRLIQEWLAQGGASPALTTPAEGAPVHQ